MGIMTNTRFLIAAICLMALLMADAATAFRFVAWADTKSGTATLKTESELVNGLNPAFTIYPGDLCDCTSTNNPTCFSNDYSTWKTAFNGGGTNNLFAKSFITRGNHDANTNAQWLSKFEFVDVVSTIGATHYSAQTEDMTYSFDYGNSHFVGIDLPGGGANTMSLTQINWLDGDLTAAESRGLTHAFLFWHGPVYMVAEHCCTGASSTLVNVLNNHPIVSAGFFGHEHVVAYTHIDSGRIPGITHEFEEFVSGDAGAGPNTIQSGRADGWLRSDGVWSSSGSLNTAHGFMSVDVNGNDYTVSIYKIDGTVAKTFSFSKAVSSVVSTPTFSPPASTYPSPQIVTISTSTSGATIHYTLDGTEPTEASTQYSTAITVSLTTTIKAKAWKTGMTESSTASATYYIEAPAQNPPIPAACLVFEKWKTVCALISQFCVTNNFPSTFCSEQKMQCEKKIDELIEKCREVF